MTPQRGIPTQQESLVIASLSLAVLLLMSTAGASSAETQTLSRASLLDKIRGGWAGQMIGVAYGAPTEFKSRGTIVEGDLEWKDGMLGNTIHQDDLYVEMTFARVMDDVGIDATSKQYGEAFKHSKYALWHANAGARRVLNQGIEAPWSGHPKYNFHANDIDFQIEADFIGLMCPGLPQESNKICDQVGRVMNHGDGLYGGMFVCGMYAAAFFETDPRKVVDAGLACIPEGSGYALLIHDVLLWSQEQPGDWRVVWQQVEDKWDVDDACPDGALDPFNIDAKINGAYIAIGLLFGNGDFEKTMEIATRCGQDSDCNPSSAAGVLGVMQGFERIPVKFLKELPELENTQFAYTDYSFKEIVTSTEVRALDLIEATGGTVMGDTIEIRTQKPVAPKLEQWNPGRPTARIRRIDDAWSWKGSWKSDQDVKFADRPGCEATLEFEGTAVALLGWLDQYGGRAEVHLDGKKQELMLDAYIVPDTHDNILWQTHDLVPGKHTLRVVTTGTADERSQGNRVAIREAVIYSAQSK